jgi:hypothetical protein
MDGLAIDDTDLAFALAVLELNQSHIVSIAVVDESAWQSPHSRML